MLVDSSEANRRPHNLTSPSCGIVCYDPFIFGVRVGNDRTVCAIAQQTLIVKAVFMSRLRGVELFGREESGLKDFQAWYQ